MCNRLSFKGFKILKEFLRIFASLGHNFTFQNGQNRWLSLTFSQINQNYIIQNFLFQRFLSLLDSDFMTKNNILGDFDFVKNLEEVKLDNRFCIY